ncbi:hypothetical protein QT711_13065 [Sporosarcina saromensis]|uniref:Uncharacterized protein n=1 Tax=Sporosarcina saromensis TaxID=359365 RepID=A0ABU4GAX9_9BACL|nr:hypothetical protein [Sporosarcina saromensis]MDW0114121.1 hypothetical protein [Sporosarcina saromensis]
MKKLVGLFIVTWLVLVGCTNDDAAKWEVSPTFTVDDKTFYGTEGKFGMIKANGEVDESAFPAGKGRLYEVHFLDSDKSYDGEKYKMVATHKESGETVKLYEWDIVDKQSGAKFALDEAGLWNIEVEIDGEPLTSFVVKAE